ncbi:hypothetical protein, conserved [Eimeria tenella]|uniref:Uncharacterized protein n=1 Tax=Eimeria tenella TaxID=5802 RepID=U6KLT5_EIMTE|nr:hypothetical protein, conserved [Eimeria tenella]CDJ39062.1 hypothetical protein, conserved [Eimeria tenella]|eukprot:XP_013229817.1 hypothetical protein, conserved [Eimeria tenella]
MKNGHRWFPFGRPRTAAGDPPDPAGAPEKPTADPCLLSMSSVAPKKASKHKNNHPVGRPSSPASATQQPGSSPQQPQDERKAGHPLPSSPPLSINSTGPNTPQTAEEVGPQALSGPPKALGPPLRILEDFPALPAQADLFVAAERNLDAPLGRNCRVPAAVSSSSSSSNCAEWASARRCGEIGAVQTLSPSTAALVFFCPSTPPDVAAEETKEEPGAAPTACGTATSIRTSSSGSRPASAAAAPEGGVWRALVQVNGDVERAEASVALFGFAEARAAAELAAERLLLQAAERRRATGEVGTLKQQKERQARDVLLRLCELLPLDCLPAAAALREGCLRLLQWLLMRALLSLLDLVDVSYRQQQQQQQQSSGKLPASDQALFVSLLSHHLSTVKRARGPEALFGYLQLLRPPAAGLAAGELQEPQEPQQGTRALASLSGLRDGADYIYTNKDGPYLLDLLLYGLRSGATGKQHQEEQQQQHQLLKWWDSDETPAKAADEVDDPWSHNACGDLPCGSLGPPAAYEGPPSAAIELLTGHSPVRCNSGSSLCCGDRTEFIDCSAVGD